MSNAVHAYVSQSDKGELVIGAGTDGYNSFTQRGGYDVIEETVRAIVELYPIFGKMKMLRQWGGIVDICPDASPIISKCEVEVYILIVVGELEDSKQHQVVLMYLHIRLLKMSHIKLMQLLT